MSKRYPIVCLCGSTKFEDEYRRQMKEWSLKGYIVLSSMCFGHVDSDYRIQEKKEMLDDMHFEKIRMADRVMIINVGGYIGESTRSEIDFAESIGKPIEYLTFVGLFGRTT